MYVQIKNPCIFLFFVKIPQIQINIHQNSTYLNKTSVYITSLADDDDDGRALLLFKALLNL